MLACRSCRRLCLQSLIGDSVLLPSPSNPHHQTSPNVRGNRRYHIRTQSHTLSTEKEAQAGDLSTLSTTRYDGTRQEKDALIKPQDARQMWLDSRGTRPANKPAKDPPDTQFVIRKHLQYLKDPVKLSEFVRKSLKHDDFDSTLELVRAASRSIQCIVSWNHLLDYLLSKGKLNAAFKIYNEMKKRAQFPDGHTYTILFRGCADNSNKAAALEKGIYLYRSMLAEKSKTKPTTIHVNAVLKMCARAGDMDAMLGIAAEMPSHGPGSPDKLTYTTIINALRANTLTTFRDNMTAMQKRQLAQDNLLKARRIWVEVTERWTKGELWIDEELVCGMGRLLLVGTSQDKDDIFSLVEQTMNIPRQFEHYSQMDTSSNESKPVIENGDDSSPQIEPFTSIAMAKSPSGSGIYANPGQNTLSLLLEALLDLRRARPGIRKGTATDYWTFITRDGKVKPDRENYLAYLRILRVARSSSEAVKVLESMPLKDMDHSTFKIAMSCCQRDILNPHVFSNAGKILDLMQHAMTNPDISVCEKYLDIAVSSSQTVQAGKSSIMSKSAQGKQILRALDRLNPHYINIRSVIAYDDPVTNGSMMHRGDKREKKKALLALTQSMISAVDILVNLALVPQELFKELAEKKARLTKYVTRANHLVTGAPRKVDVPEQANKQTHHHHETKPDLQHNTIS